MRSKIWALLIKTAFSYFICLFCLPSLPPYECDLSIFFNLASSICLSSSSSSSPPLRIPSLPQPAAKPWRNRNSTPSGPRQHHITETLQWHPSTLKPDTLSVTHTHTKLHVDSYMFIHVRGNTSTECTGQSYTNLRLKRNTTGVMIKPRCIHATTRKDRQRGTHSRVHKHWGTVDPSPNTQATLTLYGKLRGSVQRLSQLLSRSAAFPAALCSLHPIYNSQYLRPARGDAPRRQNQPFYCTCCLAN